MCKGPGVPVAGAPRAPGVPWGEIRVTVKKMKEKAGASPRVSNPMKREEDSAGLFPGIVWAKPWVLANGRVGL